VVRHLSTGQWSRVLPVMNGSWCDHTRASRRSKDKFVRIVLAKGKPTKKATPDAKRISPQVAPKK